MAQTETLISENLYSIGNPSLNDRIKSLTIDSFVVVGLMCLAALFFNTLEIQSTLFRVSIMALVFLYEPIMISVNQTLGQKIVGIKVRRLDTLLESGNTKKLNIIQSVIRYKFKIILGAVSLFTIRSNKHGQAIHDLATNSIMIFK